MNREKTNDIVFEAMIKQAVIDNFFDEFSSFTSGKETDKKYSYSESHEKRMRGIFTWDNLKTSLRIASIWAKRIAAIIILIAALSFGVLMTIPEIRAAAYEIFAEWLRRYVDPKDFSIDGDDIFFLESTGDRVVRYSDGRLTEIKLDAPARKITSRKGSFYVLYNDLSITSHDPYGNKTRFILDETISEAVSDFAAIGDYLYISAAEIEGEKTYKITLADDTGIADILESFNERIFDEETMYKTTIILEEGKSLGREAKISVRNIRTGKIDFVDVSSQTLLFGVQYLGEDNQGNHWVKVTEEVTEEDEFSGFEQNIIKILPDGSQIFVRRLEEQQRYILNQVKVYDGIAYELRIHGRTTEVVRIMPE